MRIIAGDWGGQSIPGKSNPKLRPTSDKVKESIFDQLSAKYIDDWSSTKVLDLFAGTGSLGLECLSRGSEFAYFVDHHLLTSRQLKQSISQFEAEKRSEVLCKGALEAIRWLHQKGLEFDLIFLDPPYREDWIVPVMNSLHERPILKKSGVVVAEYDKRENLSTLQGLWKDESTRRFGDTTITIFSARIH